MSSLFPWTTTDPGWGDEEHTVHLEPDRELDAVRRRWEVRTARWRAHALAESIFGEEVSVRLQGARHSGRCHFRGIVHLEVPFRDIEIHRWRERLFRACASRDPVLERVPVIYCFSPALRESG